MIRRTACLIARESDPFRNQAIEKHLMDTLTGETKELFSNYVDTYIEFLSICNTDSFLAGFRLGARFTYDTFVDG